MVVFHARESHPTLRSQIIFLSFIFTAVPQALFPSQVCCYFHVFLSLPLLWLLISCFTLIHPDSVSKMLELLKKVPETVGVVPSWFVKDPRSCLTPGWWPGCWVVPVRKCSCRNTCCFIT